MLNSRSGAIRGDFYRSDAEGGDALCEGFRDHHRNLVLTIPTPYRFRELELLHQFAGERARYRHDAILAAFGSPNVETGNLQVQILDSHVHRFRDPQSAPVKEPR